MPNLKDPSLLRQQAFVGGAWCDADDGQTIAVINPANGETVASVPHMGAAGSCWHRSSVNVKLLLWKSRFTSRSALPARATRTVFDLD